MVEYMSNLAVEIEEEKDCSFPDEGVMEITEDIWIMYFNGVANQNSYRVGIILIAHRGAHTSLAIKIKFTSTNNTAEYEACIIEIEATLSVGVEKIDIFEDLNLIISHIQG